MHYITNQTVERVSQCRSLPLQHIPLDISSASALSRLLTVVIDAAVSLSGGSGPPLLVKVRPGQSWPMGRYKGEDMRKFLATLSVGLMLAAPVVATAAGAGSAGVSVLVRPFIPPLSAAGRGRSG